MADHELKIWPDYFRWVEDGHKSFEVRRYDRNYQPGQTLLLREWDPGSKEYTGRQAERKISFMMTGGKFGIKSGFCILQLYEVATEKALQEARYKLDELKDAFIFNTPEGRGAAWHQFAKYLDKAIGAVKGGQ